MSSGTRASCRNRGICRLLWTAERAGTARELLTLLTPALGADGLASFVNGETLSVDNGMLVST